ncbi:MAG: protein-export membrane protein SecF [Alphaproteobacteria bacterium 41-28]|nr:MAG: protein-export membrane protein SecF [Alphaproteobacteria bacterium 41-28]
MGLQLIPYDTNYNFVAKKNIIFGILIAIALLCLGSIFFQGFNYGIDFKGGLLLEVRTKEAADVAKLRSDLSGLVHGEVTLQEFGGPNDILIRVERQPGGDKEQLAALAKIKEKLGTSVDYRRVDSVGPKVSEDLIRNGIYAVIWALVAMLIYIWFRFEWQFGVCSLITLAHDALIVLGLFSIFQLEFNENAIIAILITITYSINDTVVIYDRIRENLRKFKKMPLRDLINRSINETLSRTILTSTTTLLALLGLYFFGGPVIAAFSLPILVGIGAGTISSITVSAPLLLHAHLRRDQILETSENNEA